MYVTSLDASRGGDHLSLVVSRHEKKEDTEYDTYLSAMMGPFQTNFWFRYHSYVVMLDASRGGDGHLVYHLSFIVSRHEKREDTEYDTYLAAMGPLPFGLSSIKNS